MCVYVRVRQCTISGLTGVTLTNGRAAGQDYTHQSHAVARQHASRSVTLLFSLDGRKRGGTRRTSCNTWGGVCHLGHDTLLTEPDLRGAVPSSFCNYGYGQCSTERKQVGGRRKARCVQVYGVGWRYTLIYVVIPNSFFNHGCSQCSKEKKRVRSEDTGREKVWQVCRAVLCRLQTDTPIVVIKGVVSVASRGNELVVKVQVWEKKRQVCGYIALTR